MGLLDLWVTEALSAEQSPEEGTASGVAIPTAGTDQQAARREVAELFRREFLFADETRRLGELAQQLGIQIEIRRHHLNSGKVETLSLT